MAQRVLLAPPTERILSQAESLAVVQIFLNASLACIAHTRELIPWTSSCFRTRYVNQITLESDSSAGESLYSAFQSLAPESAGEGQEVKLLVRGGNRCADQMLDMLVNPEHPQQTSRSPLISSQEQGVFDALDQSYLDSLRVFVTDAAQRQPSIIETYHFAFAYERGTVTSVHLSSVAHAFVLENVHKSFRAAIRALLRSLRNLPRLPARRKLGMSLTYNETCPMVYQPPGFVDKDEYQEGEGQTMCEALLDRDEDVVGMLECGYHQMRVAVHLQDAARQEPLIDLHDTEISRQLQAMQKTSSSHSNNLLSTLRDSFPGSKRSRNGPMPGAKRLRPSEPKKPSSDESVLHSVGTNQLTEFQGPRGSAFATPGPGHQGSASKDCPVQQSLPRENGLCISVTKLAELLIHCYAVQSGKTGESGDAFDHRLLADVSIDQVQCWQHKECYGRGDNLPPATIPEEHFCYTCLLFSEGLKPPNSPLLIILLRVATGYLAAKTTPGMRIAGNFLQTQLKPFRWTRDVLDWAMERLVEEGLLKPVARGFFEVGSLDDAEMWQVKERCMGSLASVKGLFETCTNPDNTRRNDLLSSLKAYAGENDYTTAEGCEELISYDEFGVPVYRWGYDTAARNPSLKKPVVEKELTTPVRRRKISISRILINIDRSPSAASMSLEESTNRFRDNRSCSTDCSTAASTATAD
ncbi:hypothetical protein AYO21_04434 [Fonsecaea monophora]|uniref:HORMA domain-containing protein n=1 Tax=Fonsecaea monophora TaxID=254056 RepID=A0A177FC64_9EURO|nr:hypothetical protein AYO21_04434 [Fonsecaea monophora]OAG41271.1 hypothetical protein AYO21_04434 [Fonsecaea monophora]